MDFRDDEFDSAVATYTISAVPDPVAVLREMRRVVKPGGSIIVLLTTSEATGGSCRASRTWWRRSARASAGSRTCPSSPCSSTWGSCPTLRQRVNLFNGWRLIKCANGK